MRIQRVDQPSPLYRQLWRGSILLMALPDRLAAGPGLVTVDLRVGMTVAAIQPIASVVTGAP